jgi:hypothetical protein
MATNKCRLQVERLEGRDTPSALAVTIATPDHWHAVAKKLVGWANDFVHAQSSQFAARVGPIIGSRIGPIIDTPFPDATQDYWHAVTKKLGDLTNASMPTQSSQVMASLFVPILFPGKVGVTDLSI